MEHNFKIVEKSFLARLARMFLKSNNVAMVLGDKIHLSGVSSAAFLNNELWVIHELCHVKQFREHGFFNFLWLYLKESLSKGYYDNKYEVEARKAAQDYAVSKRTGATTIGTSSIVSPTAFPLPIDTMGNKQGVS